MKNKKKKSVFLAGLMVFMMMVSLLSGINLGVVKAEDGSANTATRNIFVNLDWTNMNGVSLSDDVSVPVVLTAKVGEEKTEEKAVLTKAEGWKYTFQNKPIKNGDGKDIEYYLTLEGMQEVEEEGKD